MKLFLPLILIILLCISAGCINTPNVPLSYMEEDLAEEAADSVVETLKYTADEAKKAAEYYAANGDYEYAAKQALASLYQRAHITHDLVLANANGISVANYPDNIYIEQGKDLSQYPPNAETFETSDVYISEYMQAENGQNVYLMSVPVIENGTYSGYISIAFDPYRLFGEKQEEISSFGYGLFAIQTDGILVYDSDIWEAGKNVLTDPVYADIHDLMTEICEEQMGNEYYSFYVNGGTDVVNKIVYWNTASFANREWRIAIINEFTD